MECGDEKINPYNDTDSKTAQVEQMFDSIAPAYDFMNRAMTFGIDKLWRAKAVRMLAKSAPKRILDIATGTGDLALLLRRKLKPQSIIGVDLSQGMIAIAQQKALKAGVADEVTFERGDCLNLRFADN